MSYFASNLKTLRKVKSLSQDALATILDFKRTTLSGYENEFSEPSVDVLSRVSTYFKVSIDSLISIDMSSMSEKALQDLLRMGAVDISGSQLRVLATTVSPDNQENVEVVPVSARAGYTTGYSDLEFISKLPLMSLPFLSAERKYRAFPVMGDSMPPVAQGAYVVCEYIVDWRVVRAGTFAVVVSKDDGIVFKKIYPNIAKGILQLVSTNPVYEPYQMQLDDVLEIWGFVSYISQSIIEQGSSQDQLQQIVMDLRRDVSILKEKIGV